MRNGNLVSTGIRGLVAGVIGTAAMTAWQEVAARAKRSAMIDIDERYREDVDPWEKAPAPAQLARRVIEGVTGREIPVDKISLLTNVVHWGYGTALGAGYGLAARAVRANPALRGPLFGLAVWAQSYATLVPLGLYKPPWQYPAKTIAKDISYHLVYGSGVAAGFELVRGSR
jgi:uncharacterized membrane protein YagU involved in acid resistance